MKHIAVIGAGYWGVNLVRVFAELGALAAVCDAQEDRLAALAGPYPSVARTTRALDIFSDPAITGVVIATPAATHYRLAREALLAGKDVFVEKPLALKVAEGEELVRLAHAQQRLLMVGHLLEYHPAVVALKALVDSGALGKIEYLYSHRLNLGKFRNEENILWSFAPHDLSVIRVLLQEMPTEVSAHAATYLREGVADVTVTNLSFASGARAHIFVSWLHPYKEQRLVVVGDRKMAVFNDMAPEGQKLLLYSHRIDWVDRMPVPKREDAEAVPVEATEPLQLECRHFLECIESRALPRTHGESGLQVLRMLQAAQSSLERQGQPVRLSVPGRPEAARIDPTAVIDQPCKIGEGTSIWHFSHVMPRAVIGTHCVLGQNVFVGPRVRIGNRVKLQNNVSVYTGVTLEDDVFCGPSMVFTNVINPRSAISRKHEFLPTLVKQGATLGANCVILCGHTIGRYALVGAGAVVTHDVPDYGVVYGNPATLKGWVCACGVPVKFRGGKAACDACGQAYRKQRHGIAPVPTKRLHARASR